MRHVRLTATCAHLHHERIEKVRSFDGKLGPMESMTMPFAATASTQLFGLVPGDAVRFDFTVHYDADPTLRLVRIEKAFERVHTAPTDTARLDQRVDHWVDRQMAFSRTLTRGIRFR